MKVIPQSSPVSSIFKFIAIQVTLGCFVALNPFVLRLPFKWSPWYGIDGFLCLVRIYIQSMDTVLNQLHSVFNAIVIILMLLAVESMCISLLLHLFIVIISFYWFLWSPRRHSWGYLWYPINLIILTLHKASLPSIDDF